MPEQTETLTQKPEEVVVEDKGPDSGTESESDDSIPELEDTGAGGAGEGIGAKDPVAAAAGLNEELVSKAKQSRGEKKARKIMSKLGLRQVAGVARVTIRKSKNILFVIQSLMFTRTQQATPTLFLARPKLKISRKMLKWRQHQNLPQRLIHHNQLIPLDKELLLLLPRPYPKMMKMTKR